MRETYIKRTIEIIHQLDTERLKKVYTVAKTLLNFSKRKAVQHDLEKNTF